MVAPTVANKLLPALLSQNNRGLKTPLLYRGKSDHPSSSTSANCCQCPPPRTVRPQVGDNGVEKNPTVSVAPRIDRLRRTSVCLSGPGRRDNRFTTPPIAPAPCSEDATPLM